MSVISLDHLDTLNFHQFISLLRDTNKTVYVPLLFIASLELAWKIRAVCPAVTRVTKTNVWTELECRYDISQATHGAHILSMTARHKKFSYNVPK